MENDNYGFDFLGMLGGMALILIAVWLVYSVALVNTNHMLDRGKWKCAQLVNGECVIYDRKL